MADSNDNTERNENNDDNKAQNSATDTQDTTTENSTNNSDDDSSKKFEENEARFSRLESTLERVLGEISAIREAQGIMVENGAVISENGPETDFTDVDSFVPPTELDLLI